MLPLTFSCCHYNDYLSKAAVGRLLLISEYYPKLNYREYMGTSSAAAAFLHRNHDTVNVINFQF